MTSKLFLFLIVGLILGGVIVYGGSLIDPKIEEIKSELTDLRGQIQNLSGEHEALKSLYDSLRVQHETILRDFEELKNINASYNNLLDTLNMVEVKNWTQTISFNITAGTQKTWKFFIPEQGLTWEASISFSSTYVTLAHSWLWKDKRGFVGSTGTSLVAEDHPYLPYYGPQTHLSGTIIVEWYNNGQGRTWVRNNIMTNLPEISREGDAYFDT